MSFDGYAAVSCETVASCRGFFLSLFLPYPSRCPLPSEGGRQLQNANGGCRHYAPFTLPTSKPISDAASLLVSALAILGAKIPTTLLSHKWSRQKSVVEGGVALASRVVLIGSLYASTSITFSASWAIALRACAPKTQPQRTRARASTLAHCESVVFISRRSVEAWAWC